MSAEMPYSLPRVAPSYGAPPYAYRRCPELIVVFRSSAETLRALVPEPLEPNPSDLAFLMIGSMLTDEFGAYAESIVAVPSTLGARSGNHVVFHHVNAEKPMIAGREIMGWPKRLGDVRWSEDNGRIEASTTRDGRTLIRATADMVGPAGPEHLALFPTWLNLKLIPSADGGAVPDVAQITDTTLLDVSVAEARYGTATLEFESTADDPVGRLEVNEVLGAVHALLSFDLPGAEVVHDYLAGRPASVPAGAAVALLGAAGDSSRTRRARDRNGPGPPGTAGGRHRRTRRARPCRTRPGRARPWTAG